MRTTQSTKYEFQELDLFLKHRFVPSLLLIGAVGVIEFFGLLQPLRRLSEWLLVPVMSVSGQVVQDLELPYFVVHQSFQNYIYIQDIESRYAETTAQLGELNALKKENEELRQLMEKQTKSETVKPVIAPILAYSQPYIGKGQREGVHPGDLVLIAQTLVGRVDEVSDSQSVMTLLTSTTSLPILVQTESGVNGVLMGDGTQLFMKEIPQDASIHAGERVVTLGQAEVPAGLSVGRIQSVSRSAVNSSQVAVIDQVISFYQSHIVEVQQR